MRPARRAIKTQPDDPTVRRASHPSPLVPAPGALLAVAGGAGAGAGGALAMPLSPTAAAAAAGAPGGLGVPAAPGSAAGAPPPPAAAALFASPLGSPAGMLPLHMAAAAAAAAPPLRPQLFSPVTNLRDNPPCNTLFM